MGVLDTYQELFLIEKDERAKLLAGTAPGFFQVVQVALIESIFMRIFRLMDPSGNDHNSNCSFEKLRELIGRKPNAQPREAKVFRLRLGLRQLRKDWGAAGGRYSNLKKIRNKDLAHNDYTHQGRHSTGQLWMSISDADFENARLLGGRL